MRRFPPNFIEQVRLANDIVDIIGEDTFLKGSGSRYMGLCPFPAHNEKTPSFSVSQDKQLYNCFGCGQSGNLFTYLQMKRGMSFAESVQMLAGRAGLALPPPVGHRGGASLEEVPGEDKSYQERQKLLEINLIACDFYITALRALPSTHPVKQYLKQRDFSEETIKEFRLGYAPAGWSALFNHLKKKNIDISLALRLGLIKQKADHHYDLFRDRLMFPVFAINGRDVVGFGGRILKEEKTQPKYINSSDSMVFHKGRTFYGWQNGAVAIREEGKALVVEGYTDYLSLYQRGVRNVLATLGTALTEEHGLWLSRRTEQVILFFDGDEAGKKAAERSLKTLLSFGLAPKWLRLEEDGDPDSFVRKVGAKALLKKAGKAPDLFLYLFLEDLKNYPPGVDRFALIRKTVDMLAGAKESAFREHYVSRVVDSFGSDGAIARKALEKAFRQKRVGRFSPLAGADRGTEEPATVATAISGEAKISLRSAPKSELYLLILALQNPNCYEEVKNSGVLAQLSHSGVARMFKLMEEYNRPAQEYFTALTQILSAQLEDPRALMKERYPSLTCLTPEKVKFFIQDCIKKVEKERKHLNLKDITARMRVDHENADKYLMKIAKWTGKNT